MKEMTIIPKSILEEGAIAWEKTGFRRGWNSALKKVIENINEFNDVNNGIAFQVANAILKRIEELKK